MVEVVVVVVVVVVSRSKHVGIQNLHENENNTKLNDDLVLKKIFEGKEKIKGQFGKGCF